VPDLAIVNGEVVLPGGRIEQLNIGATDGRIDVLSSSAIEAAETIDATGLTVLPGLLDEHFHVFRNFGWETYEGATRAAIKGGVTTVVDMPLDNPPPLTSDTLREKISGISGSCHVDYALFGGYSESEPDEMAAMVEAGATAFKLFTGGVAPPGMYPGVDDGQLLDAFRRVAKLNSTVTVHSENAFIVDFETRRLREEGRSDMAAWNEARPWFSETAAAQTVALVAQVTGARAVIAHASSPQTVEAVANARRRGADVWAETCHHYLCRPQGDSLDDPRAKWNPPTRDAKSVDWLWQQLREGKIHTVGSDHAPLEKDPEASIWDQKPGAGNGAELVFPVFATEAIHGRDIGIARVVELMAATPARLFGLDDRKGAIAIGGDADFAIVETNGSKRLDAQELEYHEQPKWSPFDGMELKVFPVYTVLRGKTVFAEGEVRGQPGDGELVTGRTKRNASC
jgi:dihydroorotase (multifunctional complex type)